MMQRPLITITNSNPRILNVERNYGREKHSQTIDVIVTPTGLGDLNKRSLI